MIFEETNRYSDRDVAEAIEKLKDGSAEAFHLLYIKYQNSVYRFCLKMLGSPALAKDAFQETFVKVYENRMKFKGTTFLPWVFTIARNICYNVIRDNKHFDSFDEIQHGSMKAPESDAGMKEFIDNAIQSLPISLREALILREYEEYSYQQIADVLDIDLSLAKVRVHRARLLLRKLLTPIVKELNEP